MHAKRPSIRGGKGPVSSGPTIPETRNKKTASSSLDEDDEDDEDILSSKRRGGGATNAQAEEDDVAVADDEDEGEGAAEDDVDDDDEEEVGRRSLADDDEDDDDDEAQEDEEDEENENHGLPRERIEDLGYEEAMMKNKAERANPRLGKMEALSEEDLRVIREKKEAEAAALRPVIPAGAVAEIDRQGYQVFKMDGVDFLVAESSEGFLELSNVYYYDNAIAMYARPKVVGSLPSIPRQLQIIPWIETRSPDTLKNKPGMSKMKKVYMLGVESSQPKYKVDMKELYCFDAATKVLSKCEVTTVGKPRDPVLRIRKDGITIEDSFEAPNPSLVSLGYDEMHETFRRPPAALAEAKGVVAGPVVTAAALEAMEAERQAKIEELEQMAEQMDELDESPDVPDSDMAD